MEALKCLPPGYGYADMILGPMFSSKTLELMSKLRRFRVHRTVKVLLYRATTARKEDKGKVMTHSGDEEEPDAAVSSFADVMNDLRRRFATQEMPSLLVIGLEEAQFVEGLADLVNYVNCHTEWATLPQCRIALFMTALDGTFEQKMWPEIIPVLPLCRSFHKSELACCMCCGDLQAPFSRRDTDEKELVVTGAKDKYSACCIVCTRHKSCRQSSPVNPFP
jgi:thymidine kinase